MAHPILSQQANVTSRSLLLGTVIPQLLWAEDCSVTVLLSRTMREQTSFDADYDIQ